MTDRRYTEDEVAEIFKRAAESQQTARRQLPAGEGMTLADIQGIGHEVGIPAELVAQAASDLEHRGLPASERFLGFPLKVGRTIELNRRVTDEEWDRLVVDLRETFDARGTVRSSGSLREWTNGNLQALLEPTPTGHRLRLRTTNGNARSLISMGAIGIGAFLTFGVVAAATGTLAEAASILISFGLIGIGGLALGALRLPRWAAARARQMEGVASRLALVTRSLPPGGDE